MYQKMYLTLFNAVTDALRLLEQGDAQGAKKLLEQAQQEAEELYIAADDAGKLC